MYRPIWLEQLFASDPALTRLVSATTTTVSLCLCFLAEWQFVNISGALGTKGYQHAQDLAAASGLHHEVVIISMLAAGTVALMPALTFDEHDLKGTAYATLLPAIPLLFATLVGLVLGSHRSLVLAVDPLMLGIGTLFRKFGSRGANVGIMLYMGGFFGYFLSGQFGLKAFSWIALEVLVAVIVIYVVRIPLIIYQKRSNLERAIRSYTIRARLLTKRIIGVLEGERPESSNRLHNGLVRLNEMALIIEAYMSKADYRELNESMRQTLFALELSIANLARFADSLAKIGIPSIVSRDIVDYIRAIPNSEEKPFEIETNAALARWQTFAQQHDEITPILLRRLASSIVNLNSAAITWRRVTSALPSAAKQQAPAMRHIPSVRTGHLPGSAEVSAKASVEPWETERGTSIGLTPEVRAAIQITVATSAATWIGYLVDPTRFYWAPLSAYLCFAGVHNVGEQVRKGFYRFLGTVIGVLLGSILAGLIGLNSALDAAAVLGAVFLGVYLFRVNYTFLAIGITVAISMVFLQLSELSTGLLAERVLETAVGASIASLTALFILPLSSRRVIATARWNFLRDLQKLLSIASAYLVNPDLEDELVGWPRTVDTAFHALIAAARPLQWSLYGGLNREVNELISRASAVRNYSKSFIADLRERKPVPADFPATLAEMTGRLNYSISCITRPSAAKPPPYVRIASFVESAKVAFAIQGSPTSMEKADLLFRDLVLLDGSLAALSKALKIPVTSLDTAKVKGVRLS